MKKCHKLNIGERLQKYMQNCAKTNMIINKENQQQHGQTEITAKKEHN
jgi:hypothetical protein